MQAPVEENKSFWPYGLIIGITAFVVIILAIVVTLHLRGSGDLVTKDYYEQGVAHQQQIDRQDRTRLLTGKVELTMLEEEKQMMIRMPTDTAGQKLEGTILFYRPSDSSMDKRFPLELDANGTQVIDVKDLPQGRWSLKITWATEDNLDYYHEESINLP